MKIPKKLKIAGKIYNVKIMDNVDIYGNNGNIQYKKSEIRVDKSLDIQCREQTFLHEVIHAVFDTLNIDNGESDVDTVATLLHQIIPQLEE